jgi:hypothetical protein
MFFYKYTDIDNRNITLTIDINRKTKRKISWSHHAIFLQKNGPSYDLYDRRQWKRWCAKVLLDKGER